MLRNFRWQRFVGLALIATGLAYLALCVFMYTRQDALVFHPQPARKAPPPAANRIAQTLELAVEGDVILRGWLTRPASASGRTPLIIYFSGNAEEVSYLTGEARWPEDWAVMAFNYRGYGASGGVPSEAALTRDAEAIYDMARGRPDIDPSRIAVMGRSLGTGVATFLAASRSVVRVVLVSPYDSLVDVARSHYPWLPVGVLLRHRFDSASRAPAIGAPVLAIVAKIDRTVPVEHSRALLARWRGTTQIQEIAEGTHTTLGQYEVFWRTIRDFLRVERGHL